MGACACNIVKKISYALRTTNKSYWAWYLALDMQFAIFLAPITLCLYFKNRHYAATFVIGSLLASVGAGFWYSMKTGISANSFDGIWVGEYSRSFYTKPWFRAAPYLVGMYTAMLWKNNEASACRRRKGWFCLAYFLPSSIGERASSASGWISSAWLVAVVALLSWVTFGPVGAYQHLPCPYDEAALPRFAEPLDCGSHWTLRQRAVFNAFAPLAWSCGVSMLCLLCFHGKGGWIGQLLGHPIWVPFGKFDNRLYSSFIIVIKAPVALFFDSDTRTD